MIDDDSFVHFPCKEQNYEKFIMKRHMLILSFHIHISGLVKEMQQLGLVNTLYIDSSIWSYKYICYVNCKSHNENIKLREEIMLKRVNREYMPKSLQNA